MDLGPETDQNAPRSRLRVSYFFDHDVGNFHYGGGHPMKPHRLTLAHNLVLAYKLHEKMEVYRPHRANKEEMVAFHDEDYLEFLERISPYNAGAFMSELRRFNLADDCPTFSGLFDYCRLYTGGSMDGARRINSGLCDVAINWSGGLHHARKAEASGFCFVNDIVLAIMELLRVHPRVMYIDIDVHHGDGVQDAFYYTDRVMCISLHKFGAGFFPSTGDITEIGEQAGAYYTINVPLKDGISDQQYLSMYKKIIGEAVAVYRPTAIVLQCGADSLQCDRLGRFNLSIKGHGEAVSFTRSFGIPMLVLGGGGYTVKNVARCWAYETGVSVLGQQMESTLPLNDYFQFFAPDFQLIPPPPPVPLENHNLAAYRKDIEDQVLQNLRRLGGAPSTQFAEIPPDLYFAYSNFNDGNVIYEARGCGHLDYLEEQQYDDAHIVHDAELFDGKTDQDQSEPGLPLRLAMDLVLPEPSPLEPTPQQQQQPPQPQDQQPEQQSQQPVAPQPMVEPAQSAAPSDAPAPMDTGHE